jgi:hypothetical protein
MERIGGRNLLLNRKLIKITSRIVVLAKPTAKRRRLSTEKKTRIKGVGIIDVIKTGG